MFMKIGVESRRAKVKGQRAKIRAKNKKQKEFKVHVNFRWRMSALART